MVAMSTVSMDVFSVMDPQTARPIVSKLALITVPAMVTPLQVWNLVHSASATMLSTTVAHRPPIKQIVTWLVLAMLRRLVDQEIG